MTIQVYGYVPAWELPDISPYVTKLIFYMNMVGIPFEYKSQDLSKLDTDAPHGKLPYIIDTDDNTKVADTNVIIPYLSKKFNVKLNEGLSSADLAVCTAFDRLAFEHLYWSGVIQPRWRMDEGWEIYIPYIVQGAEVGPELRAVLDGFRGRIVAEFDGQGMGRRDEKVVYDFYKADIDALSDFLGEKKYFYDDKPRVIDAGVNAILRHLVDQPMKWMGSDYIKSKANLVAYLERMKAEFLNK